MWENQQRRKRQERKRRARRRRNCLLFVLLTIIVVVVVISVKSCSDKVAAPITPSVEDITPTPVPTETVSTIPSSEEREVFVAEKDFFEGAVFLGNALADGIDRYGMLDVADFYSGVTITLENVYTTSSNNATMAIADQLKSKKFGKVFLAFGEHELSWENSGRFAKLYGELIEKVREYQPSANIFLFSIPPATEKIYNNAAYGITLQNIKAYNKALKKLAMNEKLYYIDSFTALAISGSYLDEGISSDGINLDKSGYAKLLNYASDKAYIPTATDIANDAAREEDEDTEDEDEVNDEEETKTPTQQAVERQNSSKKKNTSATATPQPTVNVLKDSATD
jgi:hypothetical protein